MFRQIGILSAFIFMAFVASAQDTLPAFTLLNKGNNRIVTSWTNAYRSAIKQLTIQRSFDSTKNFTSILTVPDPTVPQNGYVDTKATNDHMFYRLYILLDSGRYIFSKSKRPVPDTIKVKPVVKESKAPDQRIQEEPKPENKKPVTEDIKAPEPEKKEIIKPKEIPERIIYIKKRFFIGQNKGYTVL
jgi:hypothetical protein